MVSKLAKRIARKIPLLGNVLVDRDRLRNKINQFEAISAEAKVRAEKNQLDVAHALAVPLPLPNGVTEQQLYQFVTSVRVSDAPEEEMRNYGSHDFRRFVYTLGLTKDIKGRCLELGANPYFTTMLLHQFTDLELTLANYFGNEPSALEKQMILYRSIANNESLTREFSYHHFNIEQDLFPYSDSSFDVVIFAEIIEHLLMDPCKVLREIKRVLKPGGDLILTTPNVARLENAAKLLAGVNIYDPYSGYGPYGRHNREYNTHELTRLLEYEGFSVSTCFTADVHHNPASSFSDLNTISQQIIHRKNDLGQYIFMKARSSGNFATQRPSWLYRSLPQEALEDVTL